jgi:predicted aconitase
LERAPIVDAKLREATEELESLVAALAEVGAASVPSVTVTPGASAADEESRPKRAATDETWV